MLIGKGYTDRFLTEAETRDVLAQGLAQIPTSGQKILVVIPDSTRSSPIPLCFRLFTELLMGEAAKLDFIIALGTHRAMSEAQICAHIGISLEERRTTYGRVGLYNHDWQKDVVPIGVVPGAEIEALSRGYMHGDLPVEINRCIFDYDRIIICGPVFPHEVAGFSGGNKYFFPGISGPQIIDLTHWLSALIGNVNTIGLKGTPTRLIIDRAAQLIDRPKSCFSMVVKGHSDLAGAYFGTPEESQAAAAELSAQVNIKYVDRTYHTVLSVMPKLYDDIWTAGKGMYKLEPVVADGGTLIIYAPHIDEVSYTHGAMLDRIGYHVRDYFLAHMDEYRDVHPGVMAHAVHVRGAGTFENGVEKPRVNVVLATGVSKEHCARLNLGYMDPATIDIAEWQGREDEGILVVPRAGELLYRLK